MVSIFNLDAAAAAAYRPGFCEPCGVGKYKVRELLWVRTGTDARESACVRACKTRSCLSPTDDDL
jgi:hypothetical protein